MEEVVYKPYRRRVTFKLGIVFSVLWMIILVFCDNLRFAHIIVLTAGLIFCNAVSYRGQLRINSKGIFADVTKAGQSTFIPWFQIKGCKYYAGGVDSPSVCVLFQKLDVPFSGQYLYAREDAIQINRAGRILCDVDLRKLSFGRISPEQFSGRAVFGFTVTKEEYEAISAWWENVCKADKSLAISPQERTDT